MSALAAERTMTAQVIKDRLRQRHPSVDPVDDSRVGQWVCLQEWARLDLVALDCWRTSHVVGYEVKVSRSDLRAELLNPYKRAEAVARTTQFFIAAPAGMMTDEEIAFEEPEWSEEDFQRALCPGMPESTYVNRDGRTRATCGGRCRNPRHGSDGRHSARKAKWVARDTPKGSLVKLPVPAVIEPTSYRIVGGERVYTDYEIEYALAHQGFQNLPCPTCSGRGYSELSLVEREWPMLWVPKECGLIEVYQSGAIAIRKSAPRRKEPKTIIGGEPGQHPERERQAIADIVRWTAWRS